MREPVRQNHMMLQHLLALIDQARNINLTGAMLSPLLLNLIRVILFETAQKSLRLLSHFIALVVFRCRPLTRKNLKALLSKEAESYKP